MKQLNLLTATVIFMALSAQATPTKNKITSSTSSRLDSKQQALLVELTGKDVMKESDTLLYAEMVKAYEGHDEIGLKSRLQSLLSRFPQSPYADNALFLAGRFALDNNDYAQALRHFSMIEKKYRRSNKAPAALFAKGMAYKKMNLPEYASRSLKELRSRYPGSPEFFRAEAELKMIK